MLPLRSAHRLRNVCVASLFLVAGSVGCGVPTPRRTARVASRAFLPAVRIPPRLARAARVRVHRAAALRVAARPRLVREARLQQAVPAALLVRQVPRERAQVRQAQQALPPPTRPPVTT